MSLFEDLVGTSVSTFQIAIGGVKLANNAGGLSVTDNSNVASSVTASTFNATSDNITINSDAASSGADWKLILVRPSSGMTADVTITFPVGYGSPGQVLAGDGSGNLSWVSASSTADCLHCHSTTINYGDSSPATLFTLPANAIIDKVEVIINTPFNGTSPTLSVGVAGTASKYMATTQNNLAGTAKTRYRTNPGEPANGSTEALIATFSAGAGASAGAIRVLVWYTNPAT